MKRDADPIARHGSILGRFCLPAFALGLLCSWEVSIPVVEAQEEGVNLPRPVTDADFEQVKTRSPFLRTLNLTDTYQLRAVVDMGGDSLATLYNRNTKETVVVSSGEENQGGMKLVGISRANELGKVSVKVSVGGEEVELKYDAKSVTPAGQPGGPGKGPGKGDGSRDGGRKHKGPRPEEVARYKALPPDKREKFHQYIRQTMKKYPDISREERGNMIRGALIRLADGQDIELDEPSKSSPSATPKP